MTIKEAIKELQETHGMMRAYNIDSSESILMTALNTAIEALEQEPCEDAISREKVSDILKAEWVLDKPIEEWSVYRDVADLPSVTPIRPKGGWIVRQDNTSFVSQIPRRWVECSHCGWSFSYDRIKDDFCSKCGADMKGEEEENKCNKCK